MAAQLAENMQTIFGVGKPDGFAAHHIVPPKLNHGGLGDQIRALLAQHGVHLNEAANGTYVSHFTSVADEFPSLGPAHSKLHTETYLQTLWNRLNSLQNPNGQKIRDELQRVAFEIAENQFPH